MGTPWPKRVDFREIKSVVYERCKAEAIKRMWFVLERDHGKKKEIGFGLLDGIRFYASTVGKTTPECKVPCILWLVEEYYLNHMDYIVMPEDNISVEEKIATTPKKVRIPKPKPTDEEIGMEHYKWRVSTAYNYIKSRTHNLPKKITEAKRKPSKSQYIRHWAKCSRLTPPEVNEEALLDWATHEVENVFERRRESQRSERNRGLGNAKNRQAREFLEVQAFLKTEEGKKELKKLKKLERKRKNKLERQRKKSEGARRGRVNRSEFYLSEEWLDLKRKMLKLYGCKCMKCERTNMEMHVDHIKPRSKHPKLELYAGNLQILCRDCNMEKSNLNSNDYRPDWAKAYNWQEF